MNFKDLKNISIKDLAKEYKKMSIQVADETNGRIHPVIFLTTKKESAFIGSGSERVAIMKVLLSICHLDPLNLKQTSLIMDVISSMADDAVEDMSPKDKADCLKSIKRSK